MILVMGLGNPILGDDGVGWRVAQECERKTNAPRIVAFDYGSIGGISLMERLVGYDRVVLIDAVKTHRQPIGTVSCLELQDLEDPSAGHTTSPHDASLQTALQVGRQAGAHLPDMVMVVGVEAEVTNQFSDRLSPKVEEAIPRAVDAVMRQIKVWS
jgi:hydrogenase maturation protease